MKPYTFLEHTADIMVKATGKSLGDAFVNAARGMMAFLYGEEALGSCEPNKEEEIEVKSHDQESLLVDFLSELLYLSNTNYRIYIDYEILEFDDGHIKVKVGSCAGKAVDDIKAVTYHGISIEEKDEGWELIVTFDI